MTVAQHRPGVHHVPNDQEGTRVDVLDLEVSVTHGDVPDSAKQYAIDKITQLARFTRRPIVYARLRLSIEPRRAIERPALAEATLDLGGQIVRAHVAAQDPMAAIDLLDDRLRRRLERQARRTNRNHSSRNNSTRKSPGRDNGGRSTPAEDGPWRHGDLPTQRPEYYDRPVEDREVVRHKTFALEPMMCDEAAFDLDMLGHDFYLFTEIESGVDAVIFHADDDGHLELIRADGRTESPRQLAADVVVARRTPPELTLDDAEERLDTSRESFVFFINVDTERGNVVYRRYDGHYGLITPA
jgi:ribosomal subunit interface protein